MILSLRNLSIFLLPVYAHLMYVPISTYQWYALPPIPGGRRGIYVLMEQVPIPGAQSCVPSPYTSLTYLPSLRCGQCVTGIYGTHCGYLCNSQRILQRHLTQ